ncbi:MAG: hypothetical protein ACE5FY_06275 [Nitrospiria bacterium]
MEQGKILRIVSQAAICLFLVLFLVVLKVYLSSMQEFKKAETAFATKDYRNAMKHYERAILWYLPFGSTVDRSAARLWEVAEIVEREDAKLALEGYRSLRSAFYATRSFYTPGQKWIDRTDEKIASMMAKLPPYSEEEKKQTFEQRREKALDILKKPLKPDPFWSIVMEIGFLGWVAGVLLFIFKAFRRGEGSRVIVKQGLLWGGIAIVCYTLWVIGMMRA